MRRATPVRTRLAPTTNSAASTTTLLSAKPWMVSAMETAPVKGSAMIMIRPTASMRGRSITNITMAAASRASTRASSIVMWRGGSCQTPQGSASTCQPTMKPIQTTVMMPT